MPEPQTLQSEPDVMAQAEELDEVFSLAGLPGRMWPMSQQSHRQLRERLARLAAAIAVYFAKYPPAPPDQTEEKLLWEIAKYTASIRPGSLDNVREHADELGRAILAWQTWRKDHGRS
jgi:hypothetical protein